ncbi:MAG TPA: protein kinase [Verrucomicrobiota bacterium]|nr:protein kinase [Verrucomicrobiota bacterium]HNU49461.1 protein kinase [Verrucomicrobiota bacterium]
METERICPNCHRPLAPDAPQGLCPECLMKGGFGTGVDPAPGGPTHAPAFTPPPLAEIARLFPQLEIVELVGRGGMGAVYKARQPALDRWVAVKVLPPQCMARPGFAERFNREARALARLSHPNIVAVYDFGQAGDMPYFLMEYVEGVTLRRLVLERRLSPCEALRIVPQICEALQFAHDEGVVHRDIKPENILLDTKGRVKIADFGIAKLVTGEEARQPITQDQVIGTPHYMAPEQVEHPQTVDHRADIYSLGVVFYEMLTGELPLGKFQPPSRRVQVDVRLDEVVLRSLEKEPERRYQRASQVKTEVETIAQTAPPAGVSSSETGETARGRVAQEVKQPARWLLATGILNWAAVPLMVAVAAWVQGHNQMPTLAISLPLMAILLLSSIIILAALKMRHLEAYRLAVVGSILAILITPGNIIGLPVGIWSLVVLARQDVRKAFREGPLRGDAIAGPSPGPDRFWRRFAVATALVLLALILIPVALALMGAVLPALHRARLQARQATATIMPETRPGNPDAATPLASHADSTLIARAAPGEYRVVLDNGVALEIVAVARNPRGTASWWQPDGTPLATPPVEVLELPELAPTTKPEITVVPENEFLVYIRRVLPPGIAIESIQPRLTPRPSDIELPATVREISSQSRTSALLVCFAEPPATADYQEAIACGPWEAVSVYDVEKKSTQDLGRGVMALWSEPRYEQGALRFDVMHNADREHYALRMSARLRGGGHETLVFHSGVLSGSPAKGFALIHGREQEAKAWLQRVKELVIEQTPWLRGEICGIALEPR